MEIKTIDAINRAIEHSEREKRRSLKTHEVLNYAVIVNDENGKPYEINYFNPTIK